MTSYAFFDALAACQTITDVKAVIPGFVKTIAGWNVSEVVFSEQEMTIVAKVRQDDGDYRDHILLSVDLTDGHENYGRGLALGLGYTEVKMIRDLVKRVRAEPAYDVTKALLDACTKADIQAVLHKAIKLVCGRDVTSVAYEGNLITVTARCRDGVDGVLFVSDLTNSRDQQGSSAQCGISPVDLTIIGNIIR